MLQAIIIERTPIFFSKSTKLGNGSVNFPEMHQPTSNEMFFWN
jgi:hypothetical protein